ncbi:GNAT family N-acetyltransferase [Paenibacillus soyae]|uniref:GNAT family N-acetyltransferase n=1 Tax=Paenibacillus soyae TaxID=2969249 RepID=A0A9X2MTR0_9BACL|nr:GNAT family N-acetyltransferase [Paenibacillus soyae]MCR2806649.1 GNAT family N-acetyltransferase [Paenibacillus soyae]
MKMIHTERLTLRLLAPEDAEEMERLLQDKEIASTTLGIPYPYPRGAAVSFIQMRQDAAANGNGYSFAILDQAAGTFMGVIGLRINKDHNHAELGYWIGKPYWGHGYCTEAVKAVMDFAFRELELNRLYAAALTRNPGSYKVMEKAGMKHEGVFRQHLLKWGIYEDVTHYGLLRSDYH